MRALSPSALVCMFFLAGCTGGSDSGAGATPEETFETVKSAVENEDWKVLFSTMDPEERDVGLVGIVIGCKMFKPEAGKEVDEVLTKRNVDMSKLPANASMNDPAAAKKVAKDLFAGVDTPSLFGDLMNVMEKMGGEKKGFGDLKGSTLKDLKIDGDNATATIVSGDGDSDPVTFVRRDGKWYVPVADLSGK